MVVHSRHLEAQAVISQEVSKKDVKQRTLKKYSWLSLISLLAMFSAFVLFDAIIPLRGLFNYTLLPPWGRWTYSVTSFLFPDWQLQPGLSSPKPGFTHGRLAFFLFACVCILLLVLYILAVYRLPAIVSRRYIIYSALFIGLPGIISPMVTSQDIFSYVMYARMGAIYHLNPLTTVPSALPHDMLYGSIYWKNQPSVYGPTWVILTTGLQWILSHMRLGHPLAMIVVLRLLTLGAHLGSSLLIWSISGHLQPNPSYRQLQMRKRAVLAFAWNPLLLVEASINAHNDTFVLFFILIACWLLVRPSVRHSHVYAIIMLALATAIKINIVLLVPGVILYLWAQRQSTRSICKILAVYIGTVIALYAPFWQNGAVLRVFTINPGTNLNVNTLAEFGAVSLSTVVHVFTGHTLNRAGQIVHTMSIIIFIFIYATLCLRAIQRPHRLFTPLHLIQFSTLIWFLYCSLGAPWFWPWYTITFFGLFALLEATQEFSWQAQTFWGTLTLPLAIRLFTLGVLSLYVFDGQPLTAFIPGLFPMHWAHLRGLWAWSVPLYLFSLYAWPKRHQWRRFLSPQWWKLMRLEWRKLIRPE
jgi:hypothetical protein